MTCRINSISRGSSFLLQILLSNYKANNHKANNYKANRPLLVQMLICRSVERRHFPHSGNSTDCGRPVYDDDDDHDDCGAGHSDSDEEEDKNGLILPTGQWYAPSAVINLAKM